VAIDLLVLGGLAGRQQPVDRRHPRLHPHEHRHLDCGRVGYHDPQLGHAVFQPPAVTALGVSHPFEDVGLLRLESPRDQFVHLAGEDLTAPGLEQPVRDFGGRLDHLGIRLAPAAMISKPMAADCGYGIPISQLSPTMNRYARGCR
jgi:hypothetical protein